MADTAAKTTKKTSSGVGWLIGGSIVVAWGLVSIGMVPFRFNLATDTAGFFGACVMPFFVMLAGLCFVACGLFLRHEHKKKHD